MTQTTKKQFPEGNPLYERWYNEDKDFARWMDKFDARLTKRTYFWAISQLYEATKLQPKDIVQRYETGGQSLKDLVDDIDACIKKLKDTEHYGTAFNVWASVASLLIHRGIIASAKALEIKRPKQEVIPAQYVPTQEEFETMLRRARTTRNRFALSAFRFGLGRVGVLDDPEPLRLRNVLDIDFEALKTGEVKFKHETSCAIIVYAGFKNDEIERYKDTYPTFLPPQTIQLLKEYLEERIRDSEVLTRESYLFVPDRADRAKFTYPFLRSQQMMSAIKEISIASGFVVKNSKGEVEAKFTVHSLRRLFYDSIHGIDDVDKEALMWHIKGVRARYHGSVDELKKATEMMRQKYVVGMRHYTGNTEEIKNLIVIETARQQGISEEKIAEVKRTLGLAVTAAQLREAFGLTSTDKKDTKPTMPDGGKAYDALLVDENDLVQYLEAGWELVSVINNKVAIRRPTH